MASSLDKVPLACRRLLARAERNPGRAVPLARQAFAASSPDDPIAHAWATYTLGWALLCWERVDEARPLLARASDLFATNRLQHGLLRCRYALLFADKMQSSQPGLDQEFAMLAEQFAQAGLPVEAACARLEQARLLAIRRQPLDAEAVLEQVAAVLGQADRLNRARLIDVQGIIANARGDFAGAARLLDLAEQQFARLGNRREQAHCWVDQAWLALRQEQLGLALSRYQRAERVFERLDLPLLRAFCTRDIGYLMSMRGIYDLALQQTLRALRVFQDYRRYADQAGCHLHMGNIYYYAGRWDAALACYTRAESMYSAAGAVGLGLVAQRNRAMVYRAQGRGAEAWALLAALEPRVKAIGSKAEAAEIWNIKAALLADAGRADEAEQHYRQAHELFTEQGNMPGAAENVLEHGWLALRRGAFETAEQLLRSSAPALAQHPHHSWRAAYGLARCAEARGDADAALHAYRTASITVSGLRQRLASEEISSSLYTRAAQLHVDALRLAASRGANEMLIEISEYQRALVLRRLLARHLAPLPAEYQIEHDRLRERIAALLPKSADAYAAPIEGLDATLAEYGELLLRARHSFASEAEPPSELLHDVFDLADVRTHLAAAYGLDWTVLAYIINEDKLLIATVTPQSVDLQQMPFDAQLRELLKRASQRSYRNYTYRDFPYLQRQTARRWNGLHSLADRLIPPAARSRLHPNHRLLIVPAGPLNTLPWAALRVAEGWLAEHAILQIMPSLSAWQTLTTRSPTHANDALLIGCRTFGERARALPEVAAELEKVAELWPGSCERLLDAQSTRAELVARSRNGSLAACRLLHIASHAQLLSTWALAAHIKLWDADLLLPEVVGLRLGGGLVTLSACDGAAAAALPGEEVLSLSWAFLAAGAQAVLASLWPVYDTVAPRFMSLFYDNLRYTGDAALALSAAQRAAIGAHSANGDLLGEPQCWSSFVLTGGYLSIR